MNMADENKLDEFFSSSENGMPAHLKDSDLQTIRDWLEKQPHLPNISDRQMFTFLHSCYSAIELTKKTIDEYYTIRTHSPEIFNGRTVVEIEKTTQTLASGFLTKATPDGCNVLIFAFKDSEPSNFVVSSAIRLGVTLMDVFSNEHLYAEGWRLIFDATGLSFGHLAKFSGALGILRKSICYVQDGLPVRLKGIHIINTIPLVYQLLALVKPLMKKELFDLIHVYSATDRKSLHEVVPLECLPINYGGKEQSIDDLTSLIFLYNLANRMDLSIFKYKKDKSESSKIKSTYEFKELHCARTCAIILIDLYFYSKLVDRRLQLLKRIVHHFRGD